MNSLQTNSLMSSATSHVKSPLTRRCTSPTSSPPYPDLRDKLSRRRSQSPVSRIRKSSSVRSYRSRSPARGHSKQVSNKSSRRTPSPKERSPQFRTPYRPRRRSGDEDYRRSSPDRRSSSKVRHERSMSRSDHGRSSSKHSRESFSRFPREKSPGRSTKSSSRHHSSHSFDQKRRVVETSSIPQASSSSTSLAGVDVEPRVRKMLKKIVANTQAEKKKEGWNNEKL